MSEPVLKVIGRWRLDSSKLHGRAARSAARSYAPAPLPRGPLSTQPYPTLRALLPLLAIVVVPAAVTLLYITTLYALFVLAAKAAKATMVSRVSQALKAAFVGKGGCFVVRRGRGAAEARAAPGNTRGIPGASKPHETSENRSHCAGIQAKAVLAYKSVLDNKVVLVVIVGGVVVVDKVRGSGEDGF